MYVDECFIEWKDLLIKIYYFIVGWVCGMFNDFCFSFGLFFRVR